MGSARSSSAADGETAGNPACGRRHVGCYEVAPGRAFRPTAEDGDVGAFFSMTKPSIVESIVAQHSRPEQILQSLGQLGRRGWAWRRNGKVPLRRDGSRRPRRTQRSAAASGRRAPAASARSRPETWPRSGQRRTARRPPGRAVATSHHDLARSWTKSPDHLSILHRHWPSLGPAINFFQPRRCDRSNGTYMPSFFHTVGSSSARRWCSGGAVGAFAAAADHVAVVAGPRSTTRSLSLWQKGHFIGTRG